MPHARIPHLARYLASDGAHYGVREGDREEWRRLDAAPWLGGRATGTIDAVDAVRLLPPCEPTKIVCVGLNYEAHAAESLTVLKGMPPSDDPLLFLKPPSALIASGEAIR